MNYDIYQMSKDDIFLVVAFDVRHVPNYGMDDEDE